MSRVMRVYVDQSEAFWPDGWMVYACIALGLADMGLIAYVIALAVRHH